MFWFLKDNKFVKEITGCQSIARIENKNKIIIILKSKKVSRFSIFD
jgi:hypothetical protein